MDLAPESGQGQKVTLALASTVLTSSQARDRCKNVSGNSERLFMFDRTVKFEAVRE